MFWSQAIGFLLYLNTVIQLNKFAFFRWATHQWLMNSSVIIRNPNQYSFLKVGNSMLNSCSSMHVKYQSCIALYFSIYSPKVLVIPRNRWLRLNMTEKLFTGTLNHNTTKQTKQTFPSVIQYFGKALVCISLNQTTSTDSEQN